MRSSASGTRRLNFDGGGTSALRTFSISANSVSPRNSFSVVNISWRMIPVENTSVRASTGMPRICSGDMYENLPLSTPISDVNLSIACAMPKSSSLTSPS